MKSRYMRLLVDVTLGLLMLFIFTVLAGCQELPPPGPALLSPLPAATSPALQSPIAPADTQSQPTSLPNPALGTVSGVVIEASGGPPTEVVMYLGRLEGDVTKNPVVAVDRQHAPSAIPSPVTGRFIIVDVPPGKYGVIYWTPDASFLVNDPKQPNLSLFVDIKPGESIDIGTLRAPPH